MEIKPPSTYVQVVDDSKEQEKQAIVDKISAWIGGEHVKYIIANEPFTVPWEGDVMQEIAEAFNAVWSVDETYPYDVTFDGTQLIFTPGR